MPLEIDYFSQIVKITSPTTEVSGQELADFIEDQMSTPVGMLNADIIKPEGKIEDESNPGIFSQIIIIFNSPWQVQFWAGSGYTRLYGAKFVGGLLNQVVKATGAAGDITVLESPVDGVTVAVNTGSGLSVEQNAALIGTYAQLSTIEGPMDHKAMLRTFMATLCGATRDADTLGPITPATTRIEFLSMDGSKSRLAADVDAGATRSGIVMDPS